MSTIVESRPAARRAQAFPDTMRAAAIDRFGEPDVLELHALPVPKPDADEVLIALDTAGVGSWDADIRGGWYPGRRPRFPLVLGTDGSGRIAAVGSRVRRLHVGDKVYAYSWMNPKGGFYAEYAAVPAEDVAPVPAILDLLHAGGAATTGLTALQGVDDALHLRAGESVLIHGASGGVGTLAVQFAKLRDARVLATGAGRDGALLVRRLGADMAIDGRHDDVAAAAREFAPDGLHAILAFVGQGLQQAIETLQPDGRLAYPNGVEPVPRRRRGIKVVPYDAVPGVREFQKLNRAIEAARLAVPLAGVFPLDQAAQAHRRLEQGHVLGKIVLRIRA